MVFWMLAYRFGWATEADLVAAVARGLLTAAQKDQILTQ
jgi:hypothetical protein